jgi:hypothetical protein
MRRNRQSTQKQAQRYGVDGVENGEIESREEKMSATYDNAVCTLGAGVVSQSHA